MNLTNISQQSDCEKIGNKKEKHGSSLSATVKGSIRIKKYTC
jgi:hypothetical protein